MQKSFVFDVNKCTGCEACRLACEIENGLAPEVSWRRVFTFNPLFYPGVSHFHHSMACNHCTDPPCLTSCPADAYSKNPGTGAVTIDAGKCIGCGYCSWVCPYDAPQLNRATGLMEKCTFCQHRLDGGQPPACVALCPTGALQLGDYEEAAGEAGDRVPGFFVSGVGPAMQFVSLHGDRFLPDCSLSPGNVSPSDIPRSLVPRPSPENTFKTQWPLVVFTVLLAALSAWTAASALAKTEINPAALFLTGVLVLVLGSVHLGRKSRAYRALCGWRKSWLSREILLVLVFVGLSAMYFLFPAGGGPMALIPALLGLIMLFAVDLVYDTVAPKLLRLHSARAVFMGACFFALFFQHRMAFGAILVVRMLLYWRRKSLRAKHSEDTRPALTLARIVLGFVLPVALWSGAAGPPALAAAVSVLAGELIDRFEFYLELEFPSPSRQMALDFLKEIQR